MYILGILGSEHYWTVLGGSNVKINSIIQPETIQSIVTINIFNLIKNLLLPLLFFLLIRLKFDRIVEMAMKNLIFCFILIVLIYSLISIVLNIMIGCSFVHLFHPEILQVIPNGFWGFIKIQFSWYSRTGTDVFMNYFTRNISNLFYIAMYIFILKSTNDGGFFVYTKKMLNKINGKSVVDKESHSNVSKSSYRLNKEFKNTEENLQAFLVKKMDKEYLIYFGEILAVESYGNYMNLDNGKEIFSLQSTLGEILSKLPNNFKKIHRSRIINLSKVVNITPDSVKKTMTVTLENNKEYVVSRSHQAFIKSYFKNIALNK